MATGHTKCEVCLPGSVTNRLKSAANASSTLGATSCTKCAEGTFSVDSSQMCTSLAGASKAAENVLATGGVSQAKEQLQGLSESLSNSDSLSEDEAKKARAALVTMVAASVGSDPKAIDAETLSASLELMSGITSNVEQLTGDSTDSGLAFVSMLSKGNMAPSDAGAAAAAVSNLMGASEAVLDTPSSSGSTTAGTESSKAATDAAKRRGKEMAAILERVALALVPTPDKPAVLTTPKFALGAHSVAPNTSTLAASGCEVVSSTGHGVCTTPIHGT